MATRTYRWFAFICTVIAWLIMPTIVFAQDAGGSLPEDPVNVQYWILITGFFLPPLLSFIQQSKWAIATQSAVAFGVSIGVTLVQMFIYGQLDNFTDPAQSVLLVLALTITFYKGFWKPSGISPKIEERTNLA